MEYFVLNIYLSSFGLRLYLQAWISAMLQSKIQWKATETWSHWSDQTELELKTIEIYLQSGMRFHILLSSFVLFLKKLNSLKIVQIDKITFSFLLFSKVREFLNESHRTNWMQIMRFLTNPHKPMILALSRPDPKKNVTTLLKAFGECQALRELANLVIIFSLPFFYHRLCAGLEPYIRTNFCWLFTFAEGSDSW